MTRKPSAPVSARSPDTLVAVGYVMRAHGLRGEVRLKHLSDTSTILLGRTSVVLRKPEAPADVRTVRIVRSRPEKDAVLAVVEGVTTREQAEELAGLEICLPRGTFPEPNEDEWYIVDLVGLAARREDGTALGEVLDVVQYPTIDCLRVRSPDGVREVPMVEPYFLAANVVGGFVTLGALDDLDVEEPKKAKLKGPRPAKPSGRKPSDREPAGQPPAGQPPTDDGAQE